MAKKEKTVSKLKGLQKLWKNTEPKRIGAPLPPDDYVARIESAVVGESKKGRLQIDWTLCIVGDDYDGKKVHRYTGLETEENLAFLQGDLETLNLQIPDDIDDLGESLEEANGLLVAITVAKNDEFLNIYFNDVVEENEDGDDSSGEDSDDDDEIIVYEKGDRVVVEIDGDDYAGEITKVKKDKATVEFDDGDKMEVDVDELTLEADADEDDD